VKKWIIFFLISSKAMAASPEEIQLQVWANEAIVSTYTYDYANWLKRQKEIAKYYSGSAWINYSKALLEAKLPQTVKKNQYKVSAVATLPAKISKKEIINKKLVWVINMPVLAVFENPQYQQKQYLDVTIRVAKAPAGQGIRGFNIIQFISVVTQKQKCEPYKLKKPKKEADKKKADKKDKPSS
jgi:Type-IV b secretion system, inner-membrane complex component